PAGIAPLPGPGLQNVELLMPTVLKQIALVTETPLVSFSDLALASAAIQKQVTRDLGPIWDVQATVDPFPRLEDIPPGYWLVAIVETDPDVERSPIGGVHLDSDNQPFATVKFMDNWQLVASHETLEMLVDPFGNRLVPGDSPKSGQGRVEFLVEVCDPSGAAAFSYTSNGIPVSDFYTPNYFDPFQAPGVRYSFRGFIRKPREVLKGGYLSWHDPVSDEWWQESFFGDQSKITSIGKLDQIGASVRAQIDQKTKEDSLTGMMRAKAKLIKAASSYPKKIARPSEHKARAWRHQIEQLRKRSSDRA